MNCQRVQGAAPPSAATVTITPTRFRNDRKKTSASPRNARGRVCSGIPTRFPKIVVQIASGSVVGVLSSLADLPETLDRWSVDLRGRFAQNSWCAAHLAHRGWFGDGLLGPKPDAPLLPPGGRTVRCFRRRAGASPAEWSRAGLGVVRTAQRVGHRARRDRRARVQLARRPFERSLTTHPVRVATAGRRTSADGRTN